MRWEVPCLLASLLFTITGLTAAHAENIEKPATCRFVITGLLQVQSKLEETKGDQLPVSDAEFRLRTAQGKPALLWKVRTRSTTDAEGRIHAEFELPSDSKSCEEGFRFRLEARMKGDVVAARSKHATRKLWGKSPWYTLYDTFEVKWKPGQHDIGDLVFRSGGYLDLAKFDARSQADAYQLYNHLNDELVDRMGEAFGFQRRFAVKFPHNGITPDQKNGFALEMNYANPLSEVIYVIRNSVTDASNSGTYLHEVGHIWAYQHDQGPTGLIWALLTGGTHGQVKSQSVAFHEGFAAYFERAAKEMLFGTSRPLPTKRSVLTGNYSMENVEDLFYRDQGVTYFLRLLTTPEPARLDLETGLTDETSAELDKCRDPSLDFEDVLAVFFANDEQGLVALSKSEMNPARLLERWVAGGRLSAADAAAYLSLADPSASVQPRDLFCDSAD